MLPSGHIGTKTAAADAPMSEHDCQSDDRKTLPNPPVVMAPTLRVKAHIISIGVILAVRKPACGPRVPRSAQGTTVGRLQHVNFDDRHDAEAPRNRVKIATSLAK